MAREARAVIIVHGHHTIRAGYGIHELFSTPTVQLEAKVALTHDFLRQHGLLGDNGSTSSKLPSADDYLVGSAIDEALQAGTRLQIYWPMQPHGIVTDWQAMIALWKHLLFQQLHLKRSTNTSVTLLALPAPISRNDHSIISSVWFEQFNCPGLSIVEMPMLSAYATGSLTATVVDIGHCGSSITPVLDSLVQHQAIVHCPIGARECTLWLAHLLKQDASIVQALGALSEHQTSSASGSSAHLDRTQQLLIELAEVLVAEGHVHGLDEDEITGHASGGNALGAGEEDAELDVAAMLVQGKEKELIEEQAKRKRALQDAIEGKASEADVAAAITSETGQAGGSKDPKATLVTFKGLRVKIGPSRFRYAEPLFRPSLLRNVPGVQPTNLVHLPFHAGPVLDDELLGTVHPLPVPTEPVDFENAAPSLPECINAAITQVPENERRPQLWETLVITGAPTRIRGLGPSVVRNCAPFVAGQPALDGAGATAAAIGMGAGSNSLVPDEPNPVQARNARTLKVPDYFAHFKDRTDLAPFLGATIYAKLIFGDAAAKLYITKANHNEKGPTAAFSVAV